MIYFLSFFRRIKFKTAFYFSLPPGLILLPICGWICALVTVLGLTFFYQLVERVIHAADMRKKTGIKCKVCSYGDCVLLYPAKIRNKVEQKGSYSCSSFDHGHYPDIHFCPVCKNGFLDNLLGDKLAKTRAEGHKLYEEVCDDKYVENIEARYMTYEAITRDYAAHFNGKDVLEIGSYYGVFLEKALPRVKSYVGVEPSRHGCEYVRGKYPGVEVINDNVDGAHALLTKNERKFDTIVLWDVIEHVPDPIGTLRRLNALLRPGGHVIFSTINMEASFAMLLGPFWPWFMDMHYYYFSDRGYVDMLHRSGHVLLRHDHFKYYVHVSYFIEKVLSLLRFKVVLPADMKGVLGMKFPIQLGDTVLVVGKKEELES